MKKEEEKRFQNWMQDHKKQLFIAGASVAGLALLALGIKNRDAIMDLLSKSQPNLDEVPAFDEVLEKIIEPTLATSEIVAETRPYTLPQAPINVSSHIRELTGGRCHSKEKAAEAAALGIQLALHQTLVDQYTRNAA